MLALARVARIALPATNAFVTISFVSPSRREPVSRRERPAKQALSRDGLVALAFRIMLDEGLERVTMRRLAAELDTGPASLYVYVRNTAELHGALLDELLAELVLPVVQPSDDWDDLVELLCGYARLLHRHPGLARSLLTLLPHGPRYLRLFDTVLGLLLVGGVRPRAAAWGADLLIGHAVAAAAEHGTRDETVLGSAEFDNLISVAREAPADEFPHLARVRDELFSGTGEERMRWSLRALITGITT